MLQVLDMYMGIDRRVIWDNCTQCTDVLEVESGKRVHRNKQTTNTVLKLLTNNPAKM
jgi:hypothetical protein